MSKYQKEQILKILNQFFDLYFPTVKYQYFYNSGKCAELLERTYLVRANKIQETDTIQGEMDNIEFTISNLSAYFNHEFINIPIFTGILFSIKVPDKAFPYTKIESKPGFVRRNFGGIHNNQKYRIWISSDDLDQTYLELSQLFPFIKFLKSQNEDIRLYAYEDHIVFLIKSSKDLFGSDRKIFHQNRSKNEIYSQIVKIFNSYFFILKALLMDKTELEIERDFEIQLIETMNIVNKEKPA